MSNRTLDINLFLPKFYPTEQQITQKLTPLLKNIRQAKVFSFHQFQSLKRASKDKSKIPQSQLGLNFQVFGQKSVMNQLNCDSDTEQKHRDKIRQKYSKTSHYQKISEQKPRKQKISAFDVSEKDKLSPRSRDNSVNIRSKTTGKIKKYKNSSMLSGTSEFAKNMLNIDLEKINVFMKNPENHLQDFDEDLCNYIRLKMLTKNPYFTGGKFSKIKKHLVQDINLEEIQKKFYKTNSAMTKYKHFFQTMTKRNNQKPAQKRKEYGRLNMLAHRTISPEMKNENIEKKNISNIFSPNKDNNIDFNTTSYSQTMQSPDSPRYMSKGLSSEKQRKISVKTRFLFKKQCSDIKSQSRLEQADRLKQLSNTIQVKGQGSIQVSSINRAKLLHYLQNP